MKRILLAALAFTGAATIVTATPADAAGGTRCQGSVVYAWGSKYPGCNVSPPQRLHVLGINSWTCRSWGGAWGGTITLKSGQRTTICYSIDY